MLSKRLQSLLFSMWFIGMIVAGCGDNGGGGSTRVDGGLDARGSTGGSISGPGIDGAGLQAGSGGAGAMAADGASAMGGGGGTDGTPSADGGPDAPATGGASGGAAIDGGPDATAVGGTGGNSLADGGPDAPATGGAGGAITADGSNVADGRGIILDADIRGSGGSGDVNDLESSSRGSDGAACPAITSATLGAKITMSVSWPASSGRTQAGSGTADLWLFVSPTSLSDTNLSGNARMCNLALPDTQLATAVAPYMGGTTLQIQIPPSVWDQTPSFPGIATQSGWGPPNTFAVLPVLVVYGLSLPDAGAYDWPSSASGFPQGSVANPLIATPLNGTINGVSYTYPPIEASRSPAKADQVSIVTRVQVSLNGHYTSCTEQSGAANVMLFDNHVVGCHVAGGSACTSAQADFLDSNRTVYTVNSATFVAKVMPSTAACADVLSALP